LPLLLIYITYLGHFRISVYIPRVYTSPNLIASPFLRILGSRPWQKWSRG